MRGNTVHGRSQLYVFFSFQSSFPARVEESSFEVPDPKDISTDNEPSFTIIEECSKRGKMKLFHKDGFSYYVKRQYNSSHRKFQYSSIVIFLSHLSLIFSDVLAVCHFYQRLL